MVRHRQVRMQSEQLGWSRSAAGWACRCSLACRSDPISGHVGRAAVMHHLNGCAPQRSSQPRKEEVSWRKCRHHSTPDGLLSQARAAPPPATRSQAKPPRRPRALCMEWANPTRSPRCRVATATAMAAEPSTSPNSLKQTSTRLGKSSEAALERDLDHRSRATVTISVEEDREDERGGAPSEAKCISTATVPIERRDVPLGRSGRPRKPEHYPFGKLSPVTSNGQGKLTGDCFFIPDADNPARKIAAGRKRHRPKVFITRQVPGGRMVWREK